MSTDNTQSLNNYNQGKYKSFKAQKRKVLKAFSERPKTMLEVAFETNILRANICRYVAEWQSQNRITLIKKATCPITKHIAGFYCTGKEVLNEK